MSLYETLQLPEFRHTLEKLLLNLCGKGQRERLKFDVTHVPCQTVVRRTPLLRLIKVAPQFQSIVSTHTLDIAVRELQFTTVNGFPRRK